MNTLRDLLGMNPLRPLIAFGGDDAGGGVIWAPQVITDAADHGLVLSEKGKLYDTKKGQSLPAGVQPMPLLSDAELAAFPEPTTLDVVPHYVARYWDMMALADKQPAKVIGENAMLRDKPGFEVEFLTRGSLPDAPYKVATNEVLMPVRGHWRADVNGDTNTLAPGDTCLVKPGANLHLAPSMTGEASLYRIRSTTDAAGLTWRP